MKILCVLGKHNYGDPARGESYEFANFLPALRNLGHEVICFESYSRRAYRDFAELNRKFLETVQAEKPDVILCVLIGYELWLETLQLARKGSGAIIINWATDDSWKYEQFSRLIAPAFDIYATTSSEALKKSRRDGHENFFLTQWAANSANLAEPLPAKQCRYQVSFIGTAYGNRLRWMPALNELGIAVECFGHGWNNGAVAAADIPKIIRDSVISLNFADSGMVMHGLIPGRSRQIKARTFEVPGAGGFLLTESAPGLDNVYRVGEEIAVFTDLPDLAGKIRHFLECQDERNQIARAGHSRTCNEHTYEARFRELLELASFQKSKAGGHPGGIDFEQFARIEREYGIGMLLRIFRWMWRLPCVMIWGRKRGPRAARRILFELSWRIAGARTYSVTGLPGRLFYQES